MDSSDYNPTYAPWNSPYPPHAPPTLPLPPPPPLPPQSHPESPNFYGQRQYSQLQDLQRNPPPSYYSQHPPPLLQQQQQHPQYIPQIVSYEPQRVSQPLSSSIQCTESQSDWVGFNEKRRVDDGQSSNYQFDYSNSSRGSSGVGIYGSVDGRSRSRDEFRSVGYVRKESGSTRIEGNYQLKSESHRYVSGSDGNRVSSPSVVGYGSERYGVTVGRNMTRSPASHEGDINQRWGEARNGGRTCYSRKKDNHHFDRGRRQEGNELNRSPRKQMQKKSALLRLETPRSHQNSRENDWSQQHNHRSGKRFNSNSNRGKEHLVHSDRRLLEKQRGKSPVDLDVTFKSNVLVAKPVASPSSVDIRSGASVTPKSSKARRSLLCDKDEKASVTEGNRQLSREALVSEGFKQSTRQTPASVIEREPDFLSTLSTSDSEGNLNKDRFVDGVAQDRKVKISDTGPAASTHGSDAKVRSAVNAAEKISRFCETLKEANDEINVKYVSNLEPCSTEEDIIDGNPSMLKSHKDVLDRTLTCCDAGEAPIPNVMQDETVKKKTKISTSPVKLPVSWPTATDLSGCSDGGIHFTGKTMHSVGSQHCEDEDMDCIPSKNLPVMEVNTACEERKSIGSSDGPLGYGGKDFHKPSVDTSIYLTGEDPGGQVLVKSDIGGIEYDNKKINKNIDCLFPENDSSRDHSMGLVSPTSLDIANVLAGIANANNSASTDLADATNFTTDVGTYINTVVSDISVVSPMESTNLPHYENTVNPSFENASREEYMETTPPNVTAEMAHNMDSDEGKQTCVNDISSSLTKVGVEGSSNMLPVESTDGCLHRDKSDLAHIMDSDEGKQTCVNGISSSLTKVGVEGSSNMLPVESTDGCLHSDESDLAMAVPSKVYMENVSTEILVPDEDLVVKSYCPSEIPSIDQSGGSQSIGLKACLSEPIFSLSKDLSDCARESLVERDVSQTAATFCDKLPNLPAFVTATNPAIGISGISGSETVTDTESGLHEMQPCTIVCKVIPDDSFGCGSSGAIGSVQNLAKGKNSSKVSSCLVSDSSVSPCHSPLVEVNEQIQNITSIQSNYGNSQDGIIQKKNNCAKHIEVNTQEEKAKPPGGTSKDRIPATNIVNSSGDSVFSCDSASSSQRQKSRQIRSEIHVAPMVDKTSKGKQKPKPSDSTSKCRTPGTSRLDRPLSSEIHVDSVVDETSKCKETTEPSGGTSKYKTSETDIISGSGVSVFPCNSVSSSPRLSFRQIRSEIHVAAMVDDTNRVKESQKGDSLDTLQEQIMTSHELTQPGSSLAHCDLVMKPNGDLIKKPTDVTSDTCSQAKGSLNGAKIDMFDGEAFSTDGKVTETEIPGDSGGRVSRSNSHEDVKIASNHVKDPLVIVLPRGSQSKTSMSSKFEIEKRKKRSSYSTQKSYPSSLPCVSDTKKDANPPINVAKNRTWHRKPDTSPSSFVAAKPLSTLQKFPKVTAQSSSYVRKGNSLLRKPSHDSPGVALGMPESAIPLNHLTVKDKHTESPSMVENVSSLVKTGEILTLERQTKTPSDSSISKVSNAIATSAGKCMDHLTTSLPESIMDSATSVEANFPNSVADTFKTSDPLIQTGYTSDCQQKRNPPNLDSSNIKRVKYVKRKANQLVAASEINDTCNNQIPPSDSYFKRSKNQLVRNSESCVNQSMSSPDHALDTRSAANMVSERSSSTAFSDSAVMRPFKQSKGSLVWTQNDPHPRMPTAHMRYQKILPQLVPWKRVIYWKRLMNSVSAFRNGSFPNISRKLSMMRKRQTIYTKSTNGYSLRKSKVLSIGGSHLKWSKSIERDSRKANEEATLAVAAFSKKESEKHSRQNNTRTTCRNHLARERVFRFGSLRYKMDSSRRTLQRISDVDSPSGPSENGKGVKRPIIPKRLVIDNEEYVRVGNGNQLVRDPKKRTRVLANEKVRWSLHNVRLRLAKKKKYCQFFTRFGKCNKDDGKCSYVHDPSKIAVCTKFLNGLCANANCKLTHKVIPERMPDCSYFLQGLCNNESCPYRHVHVNPNAPICDGFLKGYCSDGDECRKKHSYICPAFEATGSCSQGSKCKLHHPKNQSKERKRKRPSEQPSQKNARGRYFGSPHNIISESEPMVFDRLSTENGTEGLDFISLGVTQYEAGDDDDKDPATEQFISSERESPFPLYNLIRPIALMQ